MPAELTRSASEYIGGHPEELAITDSTTQVLALIYNGLSLQAGDEILASTHDHYAHHESIRLAAERSGATWRRIALYDAPADASAHQVVEHVSRGIDPRTRVIGLTWVQSSSGVKTPVRAMAQMIAAMNRNRDAQDRILIVLDAGTRVWQSGGAACIARRRFRSLRCSQVDLRSARYWNHLGA
jgi:selenocysteine lyase/cysteine desulfurase